MYPCPNQNEGTLQGYLDAVVAPALEFDTVLNERVIPYTEQRLMYY
jgi:hypothetical protein